MGLTRDLQIQQALAAQAEACEEAKLAYHEFHVATQLGEWDRAEDARNRATAWTEAQMDAYTRAARLMREAG